jgi:hypothetical protein
MFSRMMQLVNRTDSVHLTPPQQKDVLDYAKSVPRRFAACRALEAAEDALVDRALASAGAADLGWRSAEADVRGLIRAVAVGALIDDPEYAAARWGRHLARTLDFLDSPDAADAVFDALRGAAADVLPPDAADLLAPYFDAVAGPALTPA